MAKNRADYKIGMFVKLAPGNYLGSVKFQPEIYYKITKIDSSKRWNDSGFVINFDHDISQGYDPEYFSKPIEGEESTIKILYGK